MFKEGAHPLVHADGIGDVGACLESFQPTNEEAAAAVNKCFEVWRKIEKGYTNQPVDLSKKPRVSYQ